MYKNKLELEKQHFLIFSLCFQNSLPQVREDTDIVWKRQRRSTSKLDDKVPYKITAVIYVHFNKAGRCRQYWDVAVIGWPVTGNIARHSTSSQ